MTVDIAKLRKLSAAAKDSVYGSRVADGYVAALCHAAPDLLDELERLRADHAACTCRRDREEAAERARWGTYRDNRAACPHEWEPSVWERGTFWCPLCSLTVTAEERAALAKENG